MGLAWIRIPYSWKRRAVAPVTEWDYARAALYLILPIALLIALVLLFSCAAKADELPDAPKPKTWVAETATLGALYAADFTLTARGLGTSCGPGCVMVEKDPWYGRHPSNTRLALTASAFFVADSLILRKTERSRHKWVRWGGRAFFAYTVVDEARCIESWRR